jgi:hypothetical protein
MGFLTNLFASFGTAFNAFFGNSEQKRVLANGKNAIAKIITLSESGAGYITVNQQPLVVIDLEVYPEGEEPFKASVRTIISRLETSLFQPGSMVYVKYDPLDKTKVYFDNTGGPKTRKDIGNVKEKFTLGKSGIAEILGIKKAGGKEDENQLYTLTLEITGSNIDTYTFSKDIPLPDYSLPFIQVGKKYNCVIDKDDKHKVDLDLSQSI